jgi:hypothetical protein
LIRRSQAPSRWRRIRRSSPLRAESQSILPRRSRNSCRIAPVTPQMTRPDAS